MNLLIVVFLITIDSILSLTMTSLTSIIGNYEPFLNNIIVKLSPEINIYQYQIDHICYRCESKQSYKQKCRELQDFGETLVEGMIGGRPISIIKLHSPIECLGFKITCLELPCPKIGSSYKEGLEHAEFVIGEINDDPFNNEKLIQFIDDHKNLKFDTRAINKDINADVSLDINDDVSVKFHIRPIDEVVRLEKKNNLVVPVPDDYFE